PDPLPLEHPSPAVEKGAGMIAAARLDGPIWQRLRSPRTVGTVGLVLGAFAAFLAIPPIEARGVLWPILVGILAAAFGVWTITRGERRLGWGAVAGGIIGIGLGILATRSGSDNLNTVFRPDLIASTVVFATPERVRSEEHTSELQSQSNLVCRLLLEKKKKIT